MKNKKVVIMGLGYIGLPTAAVISETNWLVHGVDVKPSIIDTINAGNIHIVEPGLEDVISSSVKKGETLNDTVQNLVRMKIDLIVIRHTISGTAHFISDQTGLPVINAGDGTNEHPTQALLDLFTLYDKGLENKDIRIALMGDILHSRVAGSSIKLWQKLGILFGPDKSPILNQSRSYQIDSKELLKIYINKL
jgi:aspartate carbamoyltransferase catalytic subunit